MISEVLLLMITCILIPVPSTEVKWTVLDTSPKLGQGLTLFCKVHNCTVDGTKRWQGGPENKVLMFHSGISTDKAKYSTSIEKNGFMLTILNLTVEYLNVSYECSCGPEYDKHILCIEAVFTDLITDANTEEESTINTSEKEDLSTFDNLNKTTNGTNYVGTHVARGVILYIAIPVILVILLIIVIVIKRHCLWRKLKEKFYGPRRRNSDISNLEPPIIPPVHEPTDGSSLPSVNSSPIQCTEEDYGQTVTDPLIQTTRVDSNTRKSSDEDDGQNVTDPFLQNTHVDPNLRQSSGSSIPSVNSSPIQCTEEDYGQTVTDPLMQTTRVDSNTRQSSGSSLPSVNSSPIQCTEEDYGQTVTDPLMQTTRVDSNARQSSDDNLHGNELLQQSQELINRVTAAESIEPSISRETSSKIVVSALPIQRTSSFITGTRRLPSKLDRSLSYSINHRDDPASTRPGKRHIEYADIKLRELSFKTCPLNKSTIAQLAEAGFFYTGDKNIARCFSCENKIYCHEGQNPLDEAFHNNCEYLLKKTAEDSI